MKIRNFIHYYTVCDVIGDFKGFSKRTGSLLIIQNGVLHWRYRSHIFDFWIATLSYFGPDARNPVLGGLRTTKAQTSLRIRAD